MQQSLGRNNAYIKKLISLKQKKHRDVAGLFMVEGYKNIFEAIRGGFHIEALLCEEQMCDEQLITALRVMRAVHFQVFCVNRDTLCKLTDTVSPQPYLAVVSYPQPTCDVRPDFAVLLNAVQDPGNVGAIIRAAAACGVGTIYYDRGCADVFSPKVIRASAGGVFLLPLIAVDDGHAFVVDMNARGYLSVATALTADAVSYKQLPAATRRLLIFGNEGQGIDKDILDVCVLKAIIPLRNNVESLNVATAAAVILFSLAD